jgi:hypothetical protein
MGTIARIGAAALFFWLLGSQTTNAACIRFEETAVGDAYLVNSCPTVMNVSYCVKGKNSTLDCSSHGFSHVPVAARARRLLWPGTKPPVAGTYEINVLSCVAPSTLVLQNGLPPTCQVDSADAG